ncbi:hypothetical protein [Sphingobium sp.]|uniref:hypothetical protein n=1 Tax=Sphingobium sp. TaxID=1912891 RepID=UPI0026099F5F|nr:hypothetical protein [Sphingobium sp.]
MMIWATILFSGLSLFVLVAMAAEEVRCRFTRPRAPGPLAGMTRGDVIMLLLYFVPMIAAGVNAIRFVLT